MSERRITFQIDIDLAKYSKEAHASTIGHLGSELAKYATEAIEERGYTVRRSKGTTTLHYVRHTLNHIVKKPRAVTKRKVSAE